jgi:hypothetical protein
MKIDGPNEIIQNGYVDNTPGKEQTQNADFKNILKESVERTAHNPVKIQSPSSTKSVSAIRLNPISLEDKDAQLADSRVSLRSIEPVMNMIVREKNHLSSVLNSIPNEDGLKEIVNRTLITASLEVIKYDRGDYISS